MTISRTRRTAALAAVIGAAALAAAGCGAAASGGHNNGGQATTGAPHAAGMGHATKPAGAQPASPSSGTVATRPAPAKRSAPAVASSASGIPQHNGGDQDLDNNGGPSDGDGGV
jgi:hypothetical protein